MTSIDEVIARERQLAKEQRGYIGTTWNKEYAKKCEEYAKEHEQLAEWLEELKAIKEKGRYVQGNKAGQKIGYRNAIDDFADRLKEMANSSSTKYIRLSEEETMTTYGVEQIAKQLKEGGENEN